MKELELRKKYKISPLTLSAIKPKLNGRQIKSKGRIVYDLDDHDKVLLRVSRVDPYTFRENSKIFCPFHRLMVYLVVTHSKEEIIDFIQTRKLLHTSKIGRFVTSYTKVVRDCLPPTISRWIKTGQDIPDKQEPWVKAIMKVVDLLPAYDDPTALEELDAIGLTTDLKFTSEIILTTQGKPSEHATAIGSLVGRGVSEKLLIGYQRVYYDLSGMTWKHWTTYLGNLKVEDKKFKEEAYGENVHDYLVKQNLVHGLQLDQFLKRVARECQEDVISASYRPPGERLKIRDSAIRNILLIKENLPEDMKKELESGSFADVIEKKHEYNKKTRIKKEDAPYNIGMPEGKEIV